MTMLSWITPVEAVMALARRAYSGSFLTIAVREGVGQNSPDAGATRCDVHIERLQGLADDGTDVTRIRQIDDGSGMTPDVLQSAFFTFGGSFKPDASSAGGYGYAKFAIVDGTAVVRENTWELWTRPRGSDVVYLVTSSTLGKLLLELPVEKAPSFFPKDSGTAIVVYRKESLGVREAVEVLENTHRPGCRYYVNGEEIEPLCRAKEKAQLSYGRLFFKKSCRAHQMGQLVVRTHGSFQFVKYVSDRLRGVAILEIDPAIDIRSPGYPLTPAREQLRTEFRAELEAELGRLLEQPRPEEEDPYVLNLYRGRVVAIERPAPPPPPPAPVIAPPAPLPAHREATVDEMMLELRQLLAPVQSPAPEPADPPVAIVPAPPPAPRRTPEVLPGDLVLTDWPTLRQRVEDQRSGAKPRRRPYDVRQVPDLLVRRHRSMRGSIDPFRPKNVRLQVAWHGVLCAIVEHFELDEKPFGIGWVIAPDVRAEHLTHGGKEFILLSPRGLQLRDIGALTATLVQRATHELLHRSHAWHDDLFVSRLHWYLEELNPHLRSLRLAVKAAVRGS